MGRKGENGMGNKSTKDENLRKKEGCDWLIFISKIKKMTCDKNSVLSPNLHLSMNYDR